MTDADVTPLDLYRTLRSSLGLSGHQAAAAREVTAAAHDRFEKGHNPQWASLLHAVTSLGATITVTITHPDVQPQTHTWPRTTQLITAAWQDDTTGNTPVLDALTTELAKRTGDRSDVCRAVASTMLFSASQAVASVHCDIYVDEEDGKSVTTPTQSEDEMYEAAAMHTALADMCQRAEQADTLPILVLGESDAVDVPASALHGCQNLSRSWRRQPAEGYRAIRELIHATGYGCLDTRA